jgi:hypothetical protein
MKCTRKKARPASRWMGFAVAALSTAPGFAHAAPADLFYERTVMTAAQERCDLFAPDVAAALASAAAQARGAALRAGTSVGALNQLERNAQDKAAAAGCASPDIATAAGRVKIAFAGFARMDRLTYPGDVADWRADRGTGRGARWKLAQDVTFGRDRMAFGLAGIGNPGALVAVARFTDGAEPYAARLLIRDDLKSSGAYLNRWTTGATADLPLTRRLPPASALKAFAASARSPATPDLLPKDAGPGWTFRFPDEAARQLASLDPREAIAVEFLFPGDVTRRAYVEVGDFAAGRAFLQLAQR